MNANGTLERPERWALPFFSIWTGQAFSILGSQLVHFSLIWWLTVTTGSATVLATASIVGLLPQVVLGPLAGALVDRWNRRVIMMAADAVIAGATVLLAALFALGVALPWHVYLVLFVRSLGGAFHFPAMAASTSLMVPKEHLARIQGANQALNGGLTILSAPLGALLLEIMPLQGILAIDVGTALLAILPLFFVQVPQPRRRENAAENGMGSPSVWEDMRAGLQYVWRWPGVMGLMLMAMVINFVLNPAFALLPLLVKNHFQGGALQLAWMESASGIGVIAGGLILGVWGGFRRRILTSLIGLIGIGAGTLLIGLAPASFITMAIGASLFVGLMMPITNGPLFAVVQAIVAPEMQGRVFTLIGSLCSAMSPLGLALAGPLSDTIGVRAWFVTGGVVTGLLGLGAFFIPTILYLEDQRQAEGAEPDSEVKPSILRTTSMELD